MNTKTPKNCKKEVKVLRNTKVTLITLLNYKNQRINFMVTNQPVRIQAVKEEYRDRSVRTMTLTDVQVLKLLEKEPFILKHL